ncbi:MAG: LysM peptidoglycan-binding domain-containing protein [Betaproteobacteria bacterium]|nr:MAG: LysM peptidoglycan-binding domain-containing protein [Betaproteobacteria bacterium]
MTDRARSHYPFFVALGLAALFAGCMTRPPAPVIERSPFPSTRALPPPSEGGPAPTPEAAPQPTYTIKRGDTLYQIALDHGLDYRELAAWNNIENVNVIRVGQVLVLAAPGTAGGAVTSPLVTVAPVAPSVETRPTPSPSPSSGRTNTSTFKTEPKALKLPYSDQALAQLQHAAPAGPTVAAVAPEARPSPAPAPPTTTSALPARPDAARVPEIDDDNLGWVWPTAGKIVAAFSESGNLKGIDIVGKAGQPVVASAAGKVVYAGSGLRGYGKLVIVKHSTTFLSAYAHNREIVVKEGQLVTKGQKIAEMGDSDADQVKLHFEIRRLGKPVDPVKFLPPA